MKFRIDRDVLVDAVAWTARSLPTRTSVPVLTGLLLQTESDQLTLAGFDYDTSNKATLPAEVSADGKVVVSGKLLAEIVKSLPAQPVSVELDNAKLNVTCGSSRFSLQTMPVDEYPELPDMPVGSGTVKADDFALAVHQASTAAGRDDMLPRFTGVHLSFQGSSITMTATDRFRAGIRELNWFPEKTDLAASVLVPARVLDDTARAFASGGDLTISISSSENGDGLIGFEATIAGGQRRTTTRLLDGDFPEVSKLFSVEAKTVAYLGAHDLADAVKRVSLVAERRTPVRLNFSEGQVSLEAGSGDDAQASEVLEATVEGPDISIGFNPGFLLDGLAVLNDPIVRLSFTEQKKPASLSGVREVGDKPDGTFGYVVMPIQLQN